MRGFLVEAVQSLTEKSGVKYAVWGTLALNIFYFWCDAIDWPPARRRRARPAQGRPFPRVVPCTARRYTIEGLTHMGRDLGILSPVEYAISCEAKQDMFRQERRGQPCWLGSPDLDPPGSRPWQRPSSQRYPSLSFSLSLSLSLARIPTRARSLLSRSATR